MLNIVAILAFAAMYWLYKQRDTSGGRYAKDPVCGMQVEMELAPASAAVDGQRYWFCSDHCRERFVAEPTRYLSDEADQAARPAPQPEATASAVDPVCGMTVDPTRTPHTAERDGQRWFFCGAGCRDHFLHADAADEVRSAGHTHGDRP